MSSLAPRGQAARPPRQAPHAAPEDRSELWDLEKFRDARRLGDWIFEQFVGHVRGHVIEVGAGIGTYSERTLARGVDRLTLVEPDPACARSLEARVGGDGRVAVHRNALPGSQALREAAGSADLVYSLNVLEHIADDAGAMREMARALRPGGRLFVLVPAHPRLYTELDRSYGHHRRYTRSSLRGLLEGAGLVVDDIASFNLLGIPGWWLQGRCGATGMPSSSLAAYDALLRLWRPVERRVRPPWGLSVIAHARAPG
ncbi:MAG: class I SAM-dependent methyltransferase [Solirubrobacteraceae bacterium]